MSFSACFPTGLLQHDQHYLVFVFEFGFIQTGTHVNYCYEFLQTIKYKYWYLLYFLFHYITLTALFTLQKQILQKIQNIVN